MVAHSVHISGSTLASKVKNLAFLFGQLNFEPGGGWIQYFKDRHRIVYENVVGEAVSWDPQAKWLLMKLLGVLEHYS